MDTKLRKAQDKILNIFARHARDFALAGGTALELYYLKHRFSADLDFFSHRYDLEEINDLAAAFKKEYNKNIKLEAEFIAPTKARVRFYSIAVKGSSRPLKLDFVEDVLFHKPQIKRINGVRVYRAEDMYLQKIAAVAGMRLEADEIGRAVTEGRKQARDAFDIYMLSKKIEPLHMFLKGLNPLLQRGMIHWYRTFSRQELKLGTLDLDIYDKKFDAKEMIVYLEREIKEFAKGVIG